MTGPYPDEIRVPQALDAEAAVLGAIMLDATSIGLVDWIREEDFYRSDHRLIFRSLRALIDRNEPCDAVTMVDWFEREGVAHEVGGAGYIIDLANSTPSAANIVAYAEIVAETSRLRAQMAVGEGLIAAASRRGAVAADVGAQAMHALGEIGAVSHKGGLVPVRGALKAVYAEIYRRYEAGGGLLGLSTPWPGLDAVTKGLRPGVVYVIGSRPSMGKTVVGLNIATHNARAGVRTGVFSIEMTGPELMTRALASEGQIPHEWVEQPTAGPEEYWARLTAAMASLSTSQLVLDDTPALRIDQLLGRARRAHRQQPLGLVVIDHLHDMDVGTGDNVRHEIGRAVQGCKALAKEMNIPVVLLCQLNRNVASRNDKRPTLTDLREAGAIEQKADVVLFLHREDYYNPDTHLKGVLEVIPAKGRQIRIGQSVHLQHRFDQMRVDPWDGPLPQAPLVEEAPRTRGYGGGRRPFPRGGARQQQGD